MSKSKKPKPNEDELDKKSKEALISDLESEIQAYFIEINKLQKRIDKLSK